MKESCCKLLSEYLIVAGKCIVFQDKNVCREKCIREVYQCKYTDYKPVRVYYPKHRKPGLENQGCHGGRSFKASQLSCSA